MQELSKSLWQTLQTCSSSPRSRVEAPKDAMRGDYEPALKTTIQETTHGIHQLRHPNSI